MTTRQPVLRALRAWILFAGLALVIIAGICPFPFQFMLAPIEAAVCVPRAASRAGVAPSRAAIEQFIVESAAKGEPRIIVNAALSRLGPLEINQQAGLEPATSLDTITIKMCLDPLISISLDVQYSAD